MKLWMKLFIFVLLLFMFTFYTAIFIMCGFVYKSSLSTVRSQAFAEHEFIASAFSDDLSAILNRNESDRTPAIASLMSHYLGYYKKQDVFLQLNYNGNIISGNIPQLNEIEALINPKGIRNSIIASLNSNRYIFVSGEIINNYVLIYSRDITSLVYAQNQLIKTLILCALGITFLFAILLYFLSHRLTKPVKTLQNVTKRITAGEYEVRALASGSDEIAVLAGCFNDMAEEILSKIEEQKKISFQKQQFIDNLAHELKTPLTTISGFAEILQKTKVSEDELIDFTSHIIRNVKRMQAMSDKLLSLAILRENDIELRKINLKNLFQEIKDEFNLRLSKNNMNLLINCEVEFINGDFLLIENLILNLVDNAIKASSPKGIIIVSSFESDSKIIIQVQDEGKGIPAEHLEFIFEPFYRVDFSRANDNVKSGTGLGLALCSQIAAVHNAVIDVDSKLNQGTKIKIIFTTPQQLHENSAT